MARPFVLAAVLVIVAPLGAAAQVGCLPPEEPYPDAPPRDDPELRAIINDEYATYVLEVEAYLNCLRDETDRASTEAREVIERWVGYFGDEAALRLRRAGPEDDD